MNAVSQNARYIVEAICDGEPLHIDYDSFDDAAAALDLADSLNRQNKGAAKARVVDSVECVLVERAREVADEAHRTFAGYSRAK